MYVYSKVLDLDGCSLDTRIWDETCSSVVDVCGLVVPAKMWWFLAVYLPHDFMVALARRSNRSEQTEAFKGGAARFTFPLTSTAVLSEILFSKKFNVCFASSGVLPK